MLYKFSPNEVIRNTIKLYPKIDLKTCNIEGGGLRLNDQQFIRETSASFGALDLYDFSSILGASIYSVIPKTSNLFIGENVGLATYTASEYGTEFTQNYPVTFEISSDRIGPNERTEYISSISQIAKLYYRHLNNQVDFDLNSITKTVINIPRMFYGSSIKKGSVSCKIFDTTDKLLIAELQDVSQNGLLYQLNTSAGPDPNASFSGSVGGYVLYNHGLIVLTGSEVLDNTNTTFGTTVDTLKWNWFLYTASIAEPTMGLEMQLSFNGVNYLNTMTMFTHAPPSQLNHSNNLTYLKYNQNNTPTTGSKFFIENAEKQIKNIVYNSIADQTASFEKETYINKIGIYDEDRKLIAITKLANPVRKRQSDGYTFKIKKDLL